MSESESVQRHTTPGQPARKAPTSGSALIYEGTRFAARGLIPLIAKLRTEGLANVPASGPAVLAPNHLAWADIPLISFPLKRITHYMAKAELFQIPVLGGYIRYLGAFPVRRGESDREALRIAERLLGEGRLVVVFPEGHRSDGHALIEAHQGVALIAMRAGAPVIPIAIYGTEDTFHGRNYLFRAPRVTVRYGEPYVLEAASGRRTSADLKRHTEEIMRRIAAMLPPQYRGVYAPLVTEGPGAAVPTAPSPLPPSEPVSSEETRA